MELPKRFFRNPVQTVTRAIGTAIAELYPQAIASHQGTFYQVTTVAGRQALFIEPDVYELIRAKVMLFDPYFFHMLPDYPKREDFVEIAEWIDAVNTKVRIEEPQEAFASITEPLSMFRCDRCGTLTSIKSGQVSPDRECPTCGGELFQAPVLVYKNEINSDQVPPQMISKITAPPCKKCSTPTRKVWPRMKALDRRSPFGSLRLYCPQHEARPDAKGAQSVSRRGRRVTLPSSSLMRPVLTTVCHPSTKTTVDLPLLGLFNPECVERVSLHKTILVHELVFGYSFPDSGIVKPLEKFLGRKFRTQGFQVLLRSSAFEATYRALGNVYRDPDLFKDFAKDLERLGKSYYNPEEESQREQYDRDQLRRWVLHSLGHALLMMLPLQTGLEASKFSYSYDVGQGRVIVYDNEEGGIGGCETATSPDVWPDYIDATRRHLAACDCRARCYRCLVLNGCGEINNALNRHLLGPVFDVATDYE